MAGKLKLYQIVQFFGDEAPNQIKNGERFYNSGHVLSFVFDPAYNHIGGRVHASQNDTSYEVSIIFDGEQIKDGTCKCSRGYKCGHMAALLLHALKEVSSTDVSCSWIKPKNTSSDNAVLIQELYPLKKIHSPFSSNVMDMDAWSKFNMQKQGSYVSFFLEAEPEPDPEQLETAGLIVNTLDVLHSPEFTSASCKATFIERELAVTWDKILAIEEATRGQSTNPLWTAARKGRLTASNFGKIIGAVHRGRVAPSLLQLLTKPPQDLSVHSLLWGQEHEKVAIREFEEKYKKTVARSGIWFYPCGFLAGSPDGLVNEDAIIEVKCPYKFRNDVLEEVLHIDGEEELYNAKTKGLKKGCYIAVHWDGNWRLNPDHEYYHQMQGNLYATQREICYLILWTTKSLVCLTIERDVDWEGNIELLKRFYYEKFLPCFLSQE